MHQFDACPKNNHVKQVLGSFLTPTLTPPHLLTVYGTYSHIICGQDINRETCYINQGGPRGFPRIIFGSQS